MVAHLECGLQPGSNLSGMIERVRLDNGLRVVVAPDRSSPVVAVSVLYDVGFRSEPEGRSGFAHLFEHMMFQGSTRVPKGEFDRLILGNGGVVNGMTMPDYTMYFEVVPSVALDMTLFLEADRMRSLLLDRENLDNQRAVVQEEIRLNVLNRPYGTFPWISLPALMFDTYPNAHDGYGSFEDLDAAHLDDVRRFFRRFYTPGNAVLTVCGDIDPDAALGLVEGHFAAIPGGRTPRRPSFAEPVDETPRRRDATDAFAPAPALALGFRVPDPLESFEEVLALDVFAAVLTDGVASRLEQRLVHTEGLVTSVDAWVGLMPGWGGALEMRDPSRLQISAFYPRLADGDRIVSAITEEIAGAVDSLGREEVDLAVTRMVAAHRRAMDNVLDRAMAVGVAELIHDDPELVERVPAMYRRLTPGAVAEAARAWLRPERQVELRVVPGGAS
jgi:zinc protease